MDVRLTLSDEAKSYVDAVVSDGDYGDASSFIEALIRADSARFDELRAQIQAGVDSGISSYTGEQIVARALEEHRRKCA